MVFSPVKLLLELFISVQQTNRKLQGLKQLNSFCLRIHNLGRAWQEQPTSALLSVNRGQLKGRGCSHLKPCSPRCVEPGLGRLRQLGLGTEVLSLSVVSLHVVCPARGSWVTRFFMCCLRLPRFTSKREPGEAASFRTQHRQSCGIPSPHSLHQGG